MKQKTKNFFKKFYLIFSLPELQILPGQLAFYFLMSFVPILYIVSLIASKITSSFNLIDTITNTLPSAISSIILPFFNLEVPSGSIFIILGCYLLLATNGPSSIIITSNELYKSKKPSFWQLKLKAFIMTLIMIVLLLFLIFIPIFGETIIKFILNMFNDQTIFIKYISVYRIIKTVVSFIFIYISIKLLFIISPHFKIKSKTVNKGALFTSIGWIIATEIFAFYITKIANYNLLYGNFANILVLLLWIYLLSYLFVIGMAMNVYSYNKQLVKQNGSD